MEIKIREDELCAILVYGVVPELMRLSSVRHLSDAIERFHTGRREVLSQYAKKISQDHAQRAWLEKRL